MATDRNFSFVAVVRRTVLDNIRLTARAANIGEAREKAKAFLKTFPEETPFDGVDYAFIENRENIDSEVLDLDIDRKDN